MRDIKIIILFVLAEAKCEPGTTGAFDYRLQTGMLSMLATSCVGNGVFGDKNQFKLIRKTASLGNYPLIIHESLTTNKWM